MKDIKQCYKLDIQISFIRSLKFQNSNLLVFRALKPQNLSKDLIFKESPQNKISKQPCTW